MTNNISEKKMKLMTITLLGILPLLGMTVDLIAPSLPHIANDLNVSNAIAKQVIFYYLIGYAFGNFITGFVADAFGRRLLLLISLAGFVIASFLPIMFSNIVALLTARLLQGLLIGASSVLMRAIFVDVLSTERLIRIGTVMGTLWGLGPVFGPTIGGYLQYYFGWQAGFWFLAIASFIILVPSIFIVPETIKHKVSLNIITIVTNIRKLLTARLFMAMVLLMGINYSIIIVFNTLGPFLVQDAWGYSPVFFGHIAMLVGAVFLSATFVCRYLLKRYQVNSILKMVIHVFLVIAVISLLLSYRWQHSIYLLFITTCLMFYANGSIYPMCMGRGMSLFKEIAATATAIMYLINICMTSASALFASFIHITKLSQLFDAYVFLMACSLLVYWLLVHEKN